jgi:hypothetical protein
MKKEPTSHMTELVNGMDHITKIGSLVSLDVTERHGTYTVNGVLNSTVDSYRGDKVTKTILSIGGERIVLDWLDSRTSALIEVR